MRSALQQYQLAHHSSSPCFAQFCNFDLVLLKFFFIVGPYTIRFFSKFTLIVELGAFDHASFIFKKKKKKRKKKKDHHHLFIKNQDFQKSCIHL